MRTFFTKFRAGLKFTIFLLSGTVVLLIVLTAYLLLPANNSVANQQILKAGLVSIGVVSLLLISMALWFIRSQFLLPIRELTGKLSLLHKLPLSEQTPLKNDQRKDEVGELFYSYNQFLDTFKKGGKQENALRKSEERYSLAIRGANDGIWDWDLSDNFCYYSPRWRYMLGYTEEFVRNNPSEWFTRVHPDDLDELKADINGHLEGHTPHFENEHRLRHAGGNYIWVIARGLAIHDENGKAYRFAGSIGDISKRKSFENRLLNDAMHDPLTELPNRAYFQEILEQALSRTHRREDYRAALIFLDLDNFKNINDTLGHAIGDKLLVETTQRLKRCVRSMDTVARFSGDEFAILLEEINGLHDVIQVAHRIHQELSAPVLLQSEEINFNASMGIVVLTRTYQNAAEILRDADTAMFQAKANGRGRYEIFDKDMHAYAISKIQLESELRLAMKNQEFKVFYQPILKADTGEITFVEALLRWQHPEKGLLSSDLFIPLAEESGLITVLNKWVLKAACSEARTWLEAGFAELRVAVNISPRLLLNPDFSDSVRAVLADCEIPSETLQLEVTESAGIYNSGIAVQNLFELTSLGVNICLDDYGLISSSLEQLKRLPVNTLKNFPGFY